MIRRSRANTSSLFLLELILAIFFFTAASAVCVQFFVESHILNRDSRTLDHAVSECSGIAEAMYAADSIQEGIALLKAIYPQGEYPAARNDFDAGDGIATESNLVEADIFLYFDADFAICEESGAAYVLSLRLSEQNRMLDATMEVRRMDEPAGDAIYGLEANHHIARRTEYEER